jgi:hypothetical protein
MRLKGGRIIGRKFENIIGGVLCMPFFYCSPMVIKRECDIGLKTRGSKARVAW